MEIRDILIYFAIKYEGDYDSIYMAIKNKEKVEEEVLKKTLNQYEYNAITLLDEDYPSCFKNIYKPPFVIFYYGHKEFLYSPYRLSVIGSREASTYGKNVCYELLEKLLLKEDVVIISGMALGIDTIAHQCALDNEKKTIGILANGIDDYYLKSNYNLYLKIKENGLLISEYPLYTEAKKDNFSFRNRLIAALGKALFVPEAHLRSGSSITINQALELGKTIMCVPQNLDDNSLTNCLIQQGAKVILKENDILEELL